LVPPSVKQRPNALQGLYLQKHVKIESIIFDFHGSTTHAPQDDSVIYDLRLDALYLVYAGEHSFALDKNVTASSLKDALRLVI
jgi:hypothetical protein